MHFHTLLWGLASVVGVTQSVTVYSQVRFGESTKTLTAQAGNYTPPAAYDPTQLNPPGLPSDLPPTTFTLQLGSNNNTQNGLSIPLAGSFFGFSIEMSVTNQVLGKNSTLLQVPFLNLMSLLKQRGGNVHIRVGGNTQETATLVDSLPDGKILEKAGINTAITTQTPSLLFTADMVYMMNNISQLVGVKWYLGVPMNDTTHLRLQIAEIGEAILGDNLLGFQVGNEPDLYGRHTLGNRSPDYSPQDYFTEFGQMMTGINNDAQIPIKSNIIGPSVTGDQWTPEQVFDTGYLTAYAKNLAYISVEKYPDDNCQAIYGGNSAPKNYQTEFALYLTHNSGKNIVSGFLDASNTAQSIGKPFLMFETNSASCGGFPGISDSYGSALWGLDYALTMAVSNFSGALLHVGGQDVYYNPFTPPPTNQSAFHQWTVSPIFFSNLIMAEALGPTGTAQVADLDANGANEFTPAYAIYENGVPARVALFNYMTDPSGQNTYTASIQIGGSGSLSQVKVKYLSAASTAEKYNMTWAGQNFGGFFASDGRLQGNLSVQTVQCKDNVCQIQVPAPGFALVFLTDTAFTEVNPAPGAVPTFSTTTFKTNANTATIDPSVLATSNGHGGKGGMLLLGSTSQEKSAARRAVVVPWVGAAAAVAFGAAIVGRQVWRFT